MIKATIPAVLLVGLFSSILLASADQPEAADTYKSEYVTSDQASETQEHKSSVAKETTHDEMLATRTEKKKDKREFFRRPN